ncbi:hypothetical protein SO694_00002863 [Aureococcus anophagefferens]|uniref:Uncharacterized protein n=1 Tax=Aureococcus anophagefferens TaxID=44056 RepID=A0ABR1GCY2_AURAN
MIARPKMSRNEWKTAERGAFDAGKFASFRGPGRARSSSSRARALEGADAVERELRADVAQRDADLAAAREAAAALEAAAATAARRGRRRRWAASGGRRGRRAGVAAAAEGRAAALETAAMAREELDRELRNRHVYVAAALRDATRDIASAQGRANLRDDARSTAVAAAEAAPRPPATADGALADKLAAVEARAAAERARDAAQADALDAETRLASSKMAASAAAREKGASTPLTGPRRARALETLGAARDADLGAATAARDDRDGAVGAVLATYRQRALDFEAARVQGPRGR